MHLPTFPRAMPVTRRVQTDFRGYDHRPGCPEGGIYEMTNGSAAAAPRFSTSASIPDASSSTSASRHGTSVSPASRAARRRRSPATSSYALPA